jgi:hypothetical protein
VDGSNRRVRLSRAAFFLVLAIVVSALVALPFSVASMVDYFSRPINRIAFHVWVAKPGTPMKVLLNVEAATLDPVAHTVDLRVSGDLLCRAACGPETVMFFALKSEPRGSFGTPPGHDVTLTPSGETDTDVTLPVAGRLSAYPFDRYHLLLGVAMAEQNPGGTVDPLPPAKARGELDLTVDEQIPRLYMARPRDVSFRSFRSAFPVAPIALATWMNFSRPFYLQALTVFIVAFVAVASIYSALTRKFNELLATIGVVILGIWGVRTLLVGSFPPDSTSVDLVLTFLILVVLAILAVRGLSHLWVGSHVEAVADPEEGEVEESVLHGE